MNMNTQFIGFKWIFKKRFIVIRAITISLDKVIENLLFREYHDDIVVKYYQGGEVW